MAVLLLVAGLLLVASHMLFDGGRGDGRRLRIEADSR